MILLAYLAAVVGANLIVTAFGPSASVFTAFLLIGATLTLRDVLHDRWRGRHLKVRMAGLIATGAFLSWLINGNAGPIALASCIAFAASESTDALVYHLLRRSSWLRRANVSNVAAAAVDSLIFPTLAFGGLLWPIVLGQFLAKTLGGALWTALLRSRRARLATAAVSLFLIGASVTEAQGKPPTIVVQVQAGPMFYPWETKPIGNYGANVLLFPPRPFQRFSLLSVYSRDVTPGAQWVGVVALQFRVWSK